jgi:hypothetical protein
MALDERGIQNLIEGWWNKARGEGDVFSKFVFLWFCFNAWLAYRSQKVTDSDMIAWLKRSSSDNSDLKKSYQMLTHSHFKEVLKGLARLSPIRDPRPRGKKIEIKDVNDFPNIVDAIYQIRCNLFHGRKEANVDRDRNLVQLSGEILFYWVGSLINYWKQNP